MAIVLDPANGVTFNDLSLQGAAASPYVLKNRIINGDMRIDQRNAGASVTQSTSVVYTVDRWWIYGSAASKFTLQQQTSVVPTGYTHAIKATSSSAYTVASTDEFDIAQYIEGFNVADLGWGTANAKTVTLSFLVYSSLTGTFGGQIANYNSSRSYPFSYTISSANTWTTISVTIPGDTSGTWYTNSSAGILVLFSLGAGSTKSGTAGTWASANYTSATGATSVVGTNGATFYITGVQLEVGSTATPFERRMITTELQLCQRYYWKFTGPSYAGVCAGYSNSTTGGNFIIKYPVTMRSAPTFSTGGLSINNAAGNYAVTSVASGYAGTDTAFTAIATASGLTAGQGCIMTINSAGTGYLDGTAEL